MEYNTKVPQPQQENSEGREERHTNVSRRSILPQKKIVRRREVGERLREGFPSVWPGRRMASGASGRAEHAAAAERVGVSGTHSRSGEETEHPSPRSERASQAQPETRRYLAHAALCCLACGAADVGASLFAPFFPAHAAERGLSSSLIGIIFALPMISMLLVTPFVPAVQHRLGVRLTLVGSMLGQAICILLFGFVDRLPASSPIGFSVACLGARAALGVASAASEVAAATILIADAPDRLRAQALGWAEAARGLGSMVGPPLGGLFFEYGGFSLPFLVVGAANSLLVLPLLRLPKGSGSEENVPVSMLSLLRLPPALAGAIVIGGAMVAISFLEPTLQPFLAGEPFYLSEAQTGLVFSALTIAYIAASLFAGRLSRLLGDEPQLLLGLTLMAIGYLFVGPAPTIGHLFASDQSGVTDVPFANPALVGARDASHNGVVHLPKQDSLRPKDSTLLYRAGSEIPVGGGAGASVKPLALSRVLISLLVVGVGGGLAYVPTNSISLRVAAKNGISVEQAGASLAAIVNLSYCSGAALGPLLGGLLVPQCGGFAVAATVFGVALLVMPVILIPLVYESAMDGVKRACRCCCRKKLSVEAIGRMGEGYREELLVDTPVSHEAPGPSLAGSISSNNAESGPSVSGPASADVDHSARDGSYSGHSLSAEEARGAWSSYIRTRLGTSQAAYSG